MKDVYTKNDIYLLFVKEQKEWLDFFGFNTEMHIVEGREIAHVFVARLDNL